MARPAALSRWLLLGLVVVAHLAGLEWAARERELLTLMKPMAPPMYTRLLQPQAPPPVVAAAPAPAPAPRPAPVRIVKPRPPASQPKPAEVAPEAAAEAAAEPSPDVAQLPEPQAGAEAPADPASAAPPSEPVEAAAPETVAPAPLAAASAPAADPAASWPTDTRLTYELGGILYGGPLYGDARVQWQRDGANYQVRLDLDVKYFTNFVMMSQGEVGPEGLQPRAYEEHRPGRKRRAVQFGAQTVALDSGKTVPRPPRVQDSVSQFIDLAHRFATGQEVLEVGRTILIPLGRPGGLDRWVYDVVDKEILQTRQLGAVEAFHLRPRPLDKPRGDYSADIWFAPSLQYLPVKIRIAMGNAHHVDLLVDRIEQR